MKKSQPFIAVIKELIPRPIKRVIKALLFKPQATAQTNDSAYGWFGPYDSYQAVVKMVGSGYKRKAILKKVSAALQKVKNGTAVHERDSVLFDKIEYSWPTTASLMHVAARRKGELCVLDIGGSLGSLYYQNRKFLKKIKCKWLVVEQENFVAEGKKKFENQDLKFFTTVQAATRFKKPDVILLSNVLSYLEKPKDFLLEITKTPCPFIIIDITAFQKKWPRDVITLQKVWPEVYDASYPSWIFYEKGMARLLKTAGYVAVEEWDVPYHNHNIKKDNGTPMAPIYFKGFFLHKNT